jgi:hypothetical protein
MRGVWVGVSMSLAAFVVSAMASPALAAPITSTQRDTFSESFSDESFLCQTELYTVTVRGRTLTHLTARTDANGAIVPPLRFHEVVRAKVVAVPLDGTGVSYVGRFRTSDSETIRSVRQGAVLAETDTDQNKAAAKGSDGSHVTLYEHHHFTINANGQVSVEFDKVRATC